MHIATLQFAPHLDAVAFNISRADALLATLTNTPQTLDLLVLPELAFTGYNFPSLAAIKPYLEPTAAGATTTWAKETAKRLNCHIIVGYPEYCAEDGRNYNSTVTVSPTGEVLLNYRKSFLYYTDETWAAEGPAGSCHAHIKSPGNEEQTHTPFFTGPIGGLANGARIGHGICMDINPYQFTSARWTDYEFATCMLDNNAKLVVLSMAWLTRLLPHELEADPSSADMETVAYWLERLLPFLAAPSSPAQNEEIIVVFANRCGTEGNVVGSVEVENGREVVETGDRVCYAGSSCVMEFQRGQGVRVFERGQGPGILGKGEEGVLVVDTEREARYLLSARKQWWGVQDEVGS